MKGKWLTYVVVMVMIVGCVDYSMQKDSGVSAFSGVYGKCESVSLQQTALIAEDFPNISVTIDYVVELKKYNESFIDASRDKMRSIVLLYLADRNLDDFKGSAGLQNIASDIKAAFNEKLGITGTNNEITKVWLTQVTVSREKNNANK